ncbi:MAG: gfo/Idh/MocA family oxidoreductase [Candidatus Hydrogenedens sp.]|nr:gfo/Idh/MocA family oxidoreductase [Candidatus Hydrogenedens sp.]
MAKSKPTRRAFLGKAAAIGAGFMIVPRHVLGGPDHTAPSDRLYIAGVGGGGQAMHDLGQVTRAKDPIVAIADVDANRAADAYKRWPDAKPYKDWREMFDKEAKNFDAVVIACPDHIHAYAATAAMRLGKHVYVEKPMAHDISEVRAMRRVAKETGVVTQMGNQGHSFPGVHRLRKWVELGAIGEIAEVNCWTNRPSWPQGVPRPSDTPPVPETLDWDLWLGPAPERPYNPAYCPRDWRGWWDFGTGSLGDMGCHILDSPYYGLQLGAPSRVSAETSERFPETAPKSSIITYEFPARGDGLPAVTLKWHDGGNQFEWPEELPKDKPLGDNDGGSLFIGTKGKILGGTYSNGMKLIPESAMEAYEHKDIEVESASKGHQLQWVAACKGEGETWSNFDYAAGLTEMVLLGNIALRTEGPIEWDGENMKITNNEAANQFLQREPRAGWSLA